MCRNVFDVLSEIGSRMSQAQHRLIFLDLDGSFPLPGADSGTTPLWDSFRQQLVSLVGRSGTSVAVMSGHDRGDLHDRLGIAGMIYLGNHGLEISGPGHIFVEPGAIEKSAALKELGNVLSAKLQAIPRATVEDKGLTLSVHHGQVSSEDVEKLRHIVHAVLAASDHPFQLSTGENTFEIRPRVYWNKATAVNWVKEQIGHTDALVIYVDDNASGENPSAAIPDAITVKVGVAGESETQLHVEGPLEVIDFLHWMDEYLQAQERGLTDERQRYSLV